jgi:CRP/FNR family transcriptional regulator
MTIAAKAIADQNRSSLAQVCRLLGLPVVPGADRVDATFLHRRLKAGSRLASQGEPVEALYVVADGHFKTFVADETGHQLVLGFPLRGDLVGADALCEQRHASYSVALTDAEVVVIPFRSLATLGRDLDEFEQLLYRAISREIVADHSLRSLVSTLGAEARVARFLAGFAERAGSGAGAITRLTLPMTRQDIGSYLGLTLETVSRAFSALADAGLIRVAQRELEVLDAEQLRSLQRVHSAAEAPRAATTRRASVPTVPAGRPVRRNVTWVDMLGAAA